jgi:hypothetical protein
MNYYQRRSPVHRSFSIVVLTLALCLALTGCPSGESPSGAASSAPKGPPLDGVYHSGPAAGMVLEFKGSKVKVKIMNESKELNYTVEGDTVMIMDPTEGNLILTKKPDGTLSGAGTTFTKK